MSEDKVEGAVVCERTMGCGKAGLSTDGSAIMLLFTREDGSKLALTFPTARLHELRAVLTDLTKQARNQEVAGSGNMVLQMPRFVKVQHNDEHRGHLAIVMNPDCSDEEGFVFSDETALQLAEMIRNDVMVRATPKDRSKLMRSTSLPSKLILPGH